MILRLITSTAIAVVLAGCIDDRTPAPVEVASNTEQSQTISDASVSDNERYRNPVDKKTYVAEGGWKEYKPGEPRPAAETGRIHNEGVRLLTAQNTMAERTSVESLAAFIKRAEASAQSTLHEVKTSAKVLVQFTCNSEKHDVQLGHQGDVTRDQLQSFYEDLLAIETLPIRSGEVSFQLTIQIDPESEQ